jgi:hypothetical protein
MKDDKVLTEYINIPLSLKKMLHNADSTYIYITASIP